MSNGTQEETVFGFSLEEWEHLQLNGCLPPGSTFDPQTDPLSCKANTDPWMMVDLTKDTDSYVAHLEQMFGKPDTDALMRAPRYLREAWERLSRSDKTADLEARPSGYTPPQP